MKAILLVAVVVAVTGCATPQERAQMTIQRFGPYCEGLGYKKDTDQWRDCIQKERAMIMADDDPVPSRTVRTNCTTIGGSVSCTSR